MKPEDCSDAKKVVTNSVVSSRQSQPEDFDPQAIKRFEDYRQMPTEIIVGRQPTRSLWSDPDDEGDRL